MPRDAVRAQPRCPHYEWARNVDQPVGTLPPSTGPLPVFVGGDLEQPCELERALAARSRHGELVFTIASEQASSYALNLVWGLRRVGIDHSLVVVLEPSHCELLASAPWLASCAHTTFRTVGLVGSVTQAYRLEWSKLHYLRRMVALGVNPLFLDADVAVLRSPYPLLRSAPLRSQHAIFANRASLAHCGRVLLGLVYCQRCRPGGPAERMFARAFARHEVFALANASTVSSWWSETDRLNLTAGPHRHVAVHRSNELMADVAISACCGRAEHYAIAPASMRVANILGLQAHRQVPRCARMRSTEASWVRVRPILHWHEPVLSGPEREAALRPMAERSRSADGFALSAIEDLDRFVEQSARLAEGRFDGEPPGLADEDAPDSTGRPRGRPTPRALEALRMGEVEGLALVGRPLIANFFDSPRGGREGGFTQPGAGAPALVHLVGAHPKERYMQALGLYDFRVAGVSWLAARRRAAQDEARDAARNRTAAQLRQAGRAGSAGSQPRPSAMELAEKALHRSGFNAMSTDILAAAAAAQELEHASAAELRGQASVSRCAAGRPLVQLSGPGLLELLRAPTVSAFAARFNRVRAWLDLVAAACGRSAVDLSLPCDQPWVAPLADAFHCVDHSLQPPPERLGKAEVLLEPELRLTHLTAAAVPFADRCELQAAQPAVPSRGIDGCCSFVWEVSTLKDSNVCTPTSHTFYHCAHALSPVRFAGECAEATRAHLVLTGEQAATRFGWRAAAAPSSALESSLDVHLLAGALSAAGAQIVVLVLPIGAQLPRLRTHALRAIVRNATAMAHGMDSCGHYCQKSLARKGACAAFGASLTCSEALERLAATWVVSAG